MATLPFDSRKAVSALRKLHGEIPLLVAGVIDDGEGGFFVQFGFDGFTDQEVEALAGTLLRDLLAALDEHHAPGCELAAHRRARVTEALAVLERDGDKPTGRQRGAPH